MVDHVPSGSIDGRIAKVINDLVDGFEGLSKRVDEVLASVAPDVDSEPSESKPEPRKSSRRSSTAVKDEE